MKFKTMTRIYPIVLFLFCLLAFRSHAQLATNAAVPLVVKTYSTNLVNEVEPAITIVPASQPALSAQTFVRPPAASMPNVVAIPNAGMPDMAADNSQSVNVTNNGLAVVVAAPKIVGQKAIVQLKLKNNLTEKIESARAVCFLLDEQGKLIGQSTKWVIGQNHTSLEPKAGTTFNFVVTSPQPFTATNLTAKVSFSRVVLDSGKLADVNKDVTILNTP